MHKIKFKKKDEKTYHLKKENKKKKNEKKLRSLVRDNH